MQLNVKSLLSGSWRGPETLEFDGKLDLTHVRRFGEQSFPDPVAVSGAVKRRDRVLAMAYTACLTEHASCARCLELVATPHTLVFEHTVVEKVEDQEAIDRFAVAPGGILDLEALALGDILSQLDGVVLCTEECRGLCPVCGGNRNITRCSCDDRIPDPRFDALVKLIEE